MTLLTLNAYALATTRLGQCVAESQLLDILREPQAQCAGAELSYWSKQFHSFTEVQHHTLLEPAGGIAQLVQLKLLDFDDLHRKSRQHAALIWDESHSYYVHNGVLDAALGDHMHYRIRVCAVKSFNHVGFLIALDKNTSNPLPLRALQNEQQQDATMLHWSHLLQQQLQRIHHQHVIAFEPTPPLTCRELEILRWTADSKTGVDIGHILGITERTVKFHLTRTCERLGTSNKTAAVSKAILLGLLQVGA